MVRQRRVRATSMAAGMGNQAAFSAIRAGGEQVRGHRAAAVLHRAERLPPFRGELVAVAGAVIALMLADDLGERDHRMFRQSRTKPCIRASMRVRADSLVWLVRCV